MNVQASTQQLAAQMLPDGTLSVSPLGNIPVSISVQYDVYGAKTAIISFGGFNQAWISFDATGTRPISFMLFSPAPTLALQHSVQNIVDYLSQSPTFH